jgi:lipopolysaccharide/colanic/teichoic acid biosynthesis glycosyltransferase
MKRILDILFAATGLVLLLPVLAVIAIVVRWTMGAPVLFRQQRPGRYGVPFTLLKFRTMRDENVGSAHPRPDAERLTELGVFLRRTSLDELPELINVFKGDMSLVGPRPLLMDYLPLYSAEQARRHEVRPGLTGWAQVNGRNSLGWDEKFRLDVWYVDNRSLVLDLRILWRTVLRVVAAKGISQPGQATAERFTGSRR